MVKKKMIKLSFDIDNEIHKEGIWDDSEYYFFKYFLLRNILEYIFLKLLLIWVHQNIKKYKKFNLKKQNSKFFKKYG